MLQYVAQYVAQYAQYAQQYAQYAQQYAQYAQQYAQYVLSVCTVCHSAAFTDPMPAHRTNHI